MKKKLIYSALLAVTILIVFFGLGANILYAKSGIQRWLPLILILGIIPILLFITLQQFIRNKAIAILIAISSILIIGPLFGIWSGYEAERDLLRNGIKTKGIVVEKWWSNPKNKTGEWLLKCQFNVASNSFRTFSTKDKNNLYILGDTLTILYSSKDPENNTIIELK